jgi:hypothetical protein
VKVSFRASFSQPIGKLNPSGFKFPASDLFVIEVFQIGKVWYGRNVIGPIPAFGKHATHGCAKDAVVECFTRQVSPWIFWDCLKDEVLDPATIEESPEGKFSRKIITHIAADNQNGAPGNYFHTHCGITVHAHLIRSKRSKDAPDCKECRVEWERMKGAPRI